MSCTADCCVGANSSPTSALPPGTPINHSGSTASGLCSKAPCICRRRSPRRNPPPSRSHCRLPRSRQTCRHSQRLGVFRSSNNNHLRTTTLPLHIDTETIQNANQGHQNHTTSRTQGEIAAESICFPAGLCRTRLNRALGPSPVTEGLHWGKLRSAVKRKTALKEQHHHPELN